MDYTLKELIDKLIELSEGNLDMPLKGIVQLNPPERKGSLFYYHNIGVELEDDIDDFGNPIKAIVIVSGGNNIKK